MKTCAKCGAEKPLSEFYKNTQKKDGLRANCKKCVSARARELHWNRVGRERFQNETKSLMDREELLFCGLHLCNKCGKIDAIENFQKTKNSKIGITNECNECRAKRAKENRVDNEVYQKSIKAWRKKNRKILNEKQRQHRKDNSEWYRENYQKHRDRRLALLKEYRENKRAEKMMWAAMDMAGMIK